ncbi:unnamed protein product [Alopecurus aequalis]
MAAALLRSSVGLALRRAAAAPAPASSSSRLSSAGGANTRAVRTFYGSDDFHSYDARKYTKEIGPASAKEDDKYDGYFTFAAFAGVFVFFALMDGGYHYWFRHNLSNPRPPRTTSRRGRW